MTEQLKKILENYKAKNIVYSEDFFGNEIVPGDVVLVNCNTTFIPGYVISISEKSICVTCSRGTFKQVTLITNFRERAGKEYLDTELKNQTSTKRIFVYRQKNKIPFILNLTKLNLYENS